MSARKATVTASVGAAVFGGCAFYGSDFVHATRGPQHPRPFSAQAVAELTPFEFNSTSRSTPLSVAGSAALASAAVAITVAGRKASTKAQQSFTKLNFAGGSYSSPAVFDPATEIGVQDPVGFWDPLGFCEDKDETTFKRRRAVEIKHGRISMYATIGYIVPEYFKFPGYLSPSLGIKFADVPNGLAALSKLPALGGAQIVAFAGLIETTGFFSGSTTDGRGARGLGQMKDSTESGEPGNYGIGFPNFVGKVEDPEERKTKLAAELANGRLAMMAIIGMFFQDGLTGSAWGDWALYTASPLRAKSSESRMAMKFAGGNYSAPAAFDPATEIGVQDPVGFWDPLGFCEDKDEATFKRRRAVEIKHGRISMYATIGYIVPEYFKFPGYLSPSLGIKFADVPNGLAALSKLPALGGAQIVAFAGLIETTGFFSGSTTDGRGARGLGQMKDSTESGEPGNYGIGFPNFVGKVEDPEERKTKLAAELANGRLAMMAIIGMFFQDGLTGSAWGDWALYTASPLRAKSSESRVAMKFAGGSYSAPVAFDPATEIGVQDPVGFWDPLGFCEDKDEATFKRRRAVEIKHGRISMYATIGYIVPEYFKFPGYLSPSLGIKFADVPNGLAALSKLPALGGAQIVAFAGLIETTGFFSGSTTDGRGARGLGQMKDSTESGEPGNYGIGFPNFVGKVEDPEERKTKLAAELANGRLAMMAIIGMFFQDGLTGSAWGDWALYTASPLR